VNAQILSASCAVVVGVQTAGEPTPSTRLPTKSTTGSVNCERTMPTCAGCDRRIRDQYLLRVAPDLEWHAACLKCVDCGQTLDERCTCFVRAGKTYCRQDYIRSVVKVAWDAGERRPPTSNIW